MKVDKLTAVVLAGVAVAIILPVVLIKKLEADLKPEWDDYLESRVESLQASVDLAEGTRSLCAAMATTTKTCDLIRDISSSVNDAGLADWTFATDLWDNSLTRHDLNAVLPRSGGSAMYLSTGHIRVLATPDQIFALHTIIGKGKPTSEVAQ